MKNSERNRRSLKMWVRISLIIIISLGIFIPSIKIYFNEVKIKNEEKKLKYSSNVNRNVDYKVQLYDNNFLDKNEMEKNQIYIAELVKNISLNFIYTYSETKKINTEYTYNIKAKIYGENVNSDTEKNEKVWEKNYTLLENKTIDNSKNDGFNITESLNIDYPKYKEEVLDFKKRFGMNLNTKLKITMNVNIKGINETDKINKNDKIEIEIPIGVQAFSIKENYKKQTTEKIYNKITEQKEKINIINIICIIIIIISLIAFILLYKLIFNIKPKSHYTKTLDKILKTYGQIIVEVNTPIKEKKLNIVIVKNFEEMVDLEEELRIPIILYENIYNYTAVFSITHNNTIYKYILKD